MVIRRAVEGDAPRIRRLAETYGLDYEGMEADPFWVAEAGEDIVGIVGLMRHPDAAELVSLAVAERYRVRGLGRDLAEALFAAAGGDVHLVTSIPEYFARLGFEKAARVPASLAARMGTSWCDGCPARGTDRCTVMVRRART